jgi:hypothetical protein
MVTCSTCRDRLNEESLLEGSNVYSEMAGGNSRDDILSAYDGVRYSDSSVLCSACLDTPSECGNCDGTGAVTTIEAAGDGDGGGGEGSDEPTQECSVCGGTGTTTPNLRRDCCRF